MASLNPLQGVLGHRRAAHLLRRCSWRYTRSGVDAFAAKTATEALADLMTQAPLTLPEPVYSSTGANPQPWINPPQPPTTPGPADEAILRPQVVAWWLNEALHDPGIGHKMQLFWHQFLAVDFESGKSSNFFDYLLLLRWGATGSFKKLITKMVSDNCMLNYLNNNQNFAYNPNENFAREFFELFTIGRGDIAGPGDYTTFTEDDVVQAALVFSGFNNANRNANTDPETGIPAGKAYPQAHDFTAKNFSARFGNAVIAAPTQDLAGMLAELDSFIDMVLTQPETSRNICRRLYRYFVTKNITQEVEDEIIIPLAQSFVTGGFEVRPVLETLLASEHFYDADDTDTQDEIIGALIKSPLDLAFQALNFFTVPIPDPVSEYKKHYEDFYLAAVLERMLGRAGMTLFLPYDVAGYSGYYQEPDFNRQFFNSATIVQRYKLPQILLTGTHAWGGSSDDSIGTRLDIAAWVRDSGGFTDPSDSYLLVSELCNYLFPEPPDTDRLEYFQLTILLDTQPPADWTYEWQNFISTGNDTEVKIGLERLITGLLYAPEYQVM